MTHKTKGIVLRTIKYGETSIVATIFTSMFGIQTYLVNAVRTSKKNGTKAAMFQPAAILELEVYHNELKGLQRIKEYEWAYLYKEVFADVIKNSIALYIVELLQKILKQPEQHTELFDFCEDILLQLDQADYRIAANLPLFFSLQLPGFFGFRMNNNYSPGNKYTDLQEGYFCAEQPTHPFFLDEYLSGLTAELLRVMQPEELTEIKLNKETRRLLLSKYEDYYRLHIPDFGQLRSLQVLSEVIG